MLSRFTCITNTIELYEVMFDLEVILLLQFYRGSLEQLGFLRHKIGIVNNFATVSAYRMVMMPRPAFRCQFIACLMLAEIKLHDRAHPHQHLYRAIDRGKTDIGIGFMYLQVDLFGGEMTVSVGENINNTLSWCGQAVTAFLKLLVQVGETVRRRRSMMQINHA